jgi:tryptophan 2,3-dioxygenase
MDCMTHELLFARKCLQQGDTDTALYWINKAIESRKVDAGNQIAQGQNILHEIATA